MIKGFALKNTEEFYNTGKSMIFPPDILKRASMRLIQLNAVTVVNDLRMPPSNNLEALSGERKGQHSIRINKQWRLCFRFVNGDAYDVEITDYH